MRAASLLLAAALGAAGAVLGGVPAFAVGASHATVATGADVSFPQCGRALPARGDIAVVGVNGGTGTTTNPCLAAQLAWGDAGGRLADVYVNTANPGRLGDWWPSADVARGGSAVPNPAGRCAGAEDAACAYVYGYSIARDDLKNRGVTRPGDRTWWLDVETMNTWGWNRGTNRAVLEGMADAIRAAGADVGIYSTTFQWSLIVGTTSPASGLAGLPSWVAGATTRAGALAGCAAAPFVPGGAVRMVQWTEDGFDRDTACGVGVEGEVPVVHGDAGTGEPLVADPGSWGPAGVQLTYQWFRDGIPIAGGVGPVHIVTADDVDRILTVAVTGRRSGAPTLTLGSDPVGAHAEAPAPAPGQALPAAALAPRTAA